LKRGASEGEEQDGEGRTTWARSKTRNETYFFQVKEVFRREGEERGGQFPTTTWVFPGSIRMASQFFVWGCGVGWLAKGEKLEG